MAVTGASQVAPYEEKASRLELLIRIIYGFIIGIIYGIWGFLVGFVTGLQFWHILIFGRRGRKLYDWTRQYLTATLHVEAYLSFLTDKRPDLIPDLDMFYRPAIPVSQTVSPPPPPPSGITPGTRFCVSCGTSLIPGGKFCPSCGRPTQ